MKKIISVLVALVAAFVLVACGSADTPDSTSEDGPLRVGLLIPEEGDYSFNDAAARGLDEAKNQYGDDIYLRMFTYKGRMESQFVEAANGDFDVLIAPQEVSGLVEEFATEFPDTNFWLYDMNADLSSEYDNVYVINYEVNKPSYLAGYLAAKDSDTGTIGFLGGVDNDNVRDFYVGYVSGAKAADPNIQVVSDNVGAWDDAAKGRELGEALFDQGASMVFNVAGGSGIGLIESAIDHEGEVIGVDLDQAAIFATRGQTLYAESIPTSVLKKVDSSIVRAIGMELDGEIPYGETESLGFAEDGVGLADNEFYRQRFDESLRSEIETLYEQVENDELEVPTITDLSEEEFQELKNSVQP